MKLAYKNVGRITKSFHGVTFRPGQSAFITKFVNDPDMIRIAVDSVTIAKKSPSKQFSKNVKDDEKETTTIIKEEQPDGTDKH